MLVEASVATGQVQATFPFQNPPVTRGLATAYAWPRTAVPLPPCWHSRMPQYCWPATTSLACSGGRCPGSRWHHSGPPWNRRASSQRDLVDRPERRQFDAAPAIPGTDQI